MPTTFEERQAIARKAVATRKARQEAAAKQNGNGEYFAMLQDKRSKEREEAKGKPAGWKAFPVRPTRKAKEIDIDDVLANAFDAMTEKRGNGRQSRDEAKLTEAYQRIADLVEGTLVSYYDQGWRYAKLVVAKPDWVTLLSIPNYGKQPQRFKVRTGDVAPIEN